MALTPINIDPNTLPWNTTTISNSSIGATSAAPQWDYTIQGKCYTVSYQMGDMEFSSHPINPDEIKKILIGQLVGELFKSNAIEFTKHHDPTNFTHTFRARIYATSSDQVKILRSAKKLD